jgi:hypothetical protein
MRRRDRALVNGIQTASSDTVHRRLAETASAAAAVGAGAAGGWRGGEASATGGGAIRVVSGGRGCGWTSGG